MSDTTLRDQLVGLSLNVLCDAANFPRSAVGMLGQDMRPLAGKVADRILAAGWRPPARVVTTWEEVQSLREGTLILVKRWGHMLVYERQKCDAWYLHGGGWLDDDLLPGTVLWEPDEGEEEEE